MSLASAPGASRPRACTTIFPRCTHAQASLPSPGARKIFGSGKRGGLHAETALPLHSIVNGVPTAAGPPSSV
jgi:hypothetical protein